MIFDPVAGLFLKSKKFRFAKRLVICWSSKWTAKQSSPTFVGERSLAEREGFEHYYRAISFPHNRAKSKQKPNKTQ